jgi:acrylyl-CoA reductase (NADPH)
VPLPQGLTAREAMVLGTAGFTAAQSVMALEQNGVGPATGPVVVTGASGGVGSLAVALLAKLGYRVSAVSGKPAAAELLKRLGAAEVLPRSAVDDASQKPLLAAHWAGAVDTVGGNTLATLLRSTQIGGCVTACGLVGGTDLNLTVYPFILRGARLLGIDSAWVPRPQRDEIWARLAGPWKLKGLDILTHELDLSTVVAAARQMLAGEALGRNVVRVAEG